MTRISESGARTAHDRPGRAARNHLDSVFRPATVAIIGASEKPGSVGRALTENIRPFTGRSYLVNPKHRELLGVTAYPDIGSVPEKVDLVVIATPAPTVPAILTACAKADVGGAVIVSAGFKEVGDAGVALEQEALAAAKRGGIRIIGPNCLGVMIPSLRLNATFADGLAASGSVAFLSQSGALCTAVLDWSLREKVAFSAFVSVGSMLDVGWGDLISYFGDDPRTKSIVCYMESVGEARSFLSAAREVALTKSIIVLKVGRTSAASKAAASHTGSMTGSDAVLDAALRRVGVLRVENIEELFDMAEVLAKQPRPRGPRLAIVTNAGGPGALATDALIASGAELSPLSIETCNALNPLLPPHWSHGNPIDILGDADATRYAEVLKRVGNDPGTDGVLAILTPQAMTEATATAEKLCDLPELRGKPLLACWMGGPGVEHGEAILNDASIPTFKYPDRAARAFALMWNYSNNLRALYETPLLTSDAEPLENAGLVEKILNGVAGAGRSLLTEVESKQVLEAYQVQTVATHLALTEDAAVEHANAIGYPVVLKLHSETITHKTDVGGVQLDLPDATAVRYAWRSIHANVIEKGGPQDFLGVTVQPMVRDGYPIILGSSIDPQFGPVLLFGSGGQLVEVFQDTALGFPPLNTTLARRMMEQTRVYKALQGVRGRKPVDLQGLAALLVRFSHLVARHPGIAEIDINPLIVSPTQMLALDARIVLQDRNQREHSSPGLAIRPYPVHYAASFKLKDGSAATVRPIRPEDEPLLQQFHQRLSDRSVYQRYFAPLQLDHRIAHERLSRICFIDYDREMALVAERADPQNGRPEILGVGRWRKLPGGTEAEFSLVVADPWQKQGIGSHLLQRLIQIGRDENIKRLAATILAENPAMQQLARKAGFKVEHVAGTPEYRAELAL